METLVPEVIGDATESLNLSDSNWVHAALIDGGYTYSGTQGKALLKLTPNNAIDIGVGIAMNYYTNSLDSISASNITIAKKTAIV